MLNKRYGLPHYGRRLLDARYAGDYRIRVRFDDGVEGEIDLSDELRGPLGKPLKDLDYFKRFCIFEECTLEWPNGYGICPDVLYAWVVEPLASV